jgi:hypothetical protein
MVTIGARHCNLLTILPFTHTVHFLYEFHNNSDGINPWPANVENMVS